MSTTSQKHHNFVSEPMGDKSVTELAGIGEVLGKRLDAKGFDKVCLPPLQLLILNGLIAIMVSNRPLVFLTGLRRSRSVFGTEKEPGTICRVAERNCLRKREASQRLLLLSDRMVRSVPVRLPRHHCHTTSWTSYLCSWRRYGSMKAARVHLSHFF